LAVAEHGNLKKKMQYYKKITKILLWNPLSFLFNWCWGLFPWGQDKISTECQGPECMGLHYHLALECKHALWTFKLQNFFFINITKHNHKIYNIDHEFGLTKIWDKTISNTKFKTTNNSAYSFLFKTL
jgi:hypothetical protein